MIKEKKFGLYVVRPQDIPETEKYYQVTPKYSLLYTDNKPPKINKKIQNIKALPDSVIAWLNSCINEIRLEYLAENQDEVMEKATAFANRLEQELNAERQKGEVVNE